MERRRVGVVSTTNSGGCTEAKAHLIAREHGVAHKVTLEAAHVKKVMLATQKVKACYGSAKRDTWRFGVSLPSGRATSESVDWFG